MTEFDKREEAFEQRFAHDEELKFKATARRNKLLGLWAAEKLGLSGAEADSYALSVVMAAEGYPDKPAVGDRIEGLDAPLAPGSFVFHAGTKRQGDAIVTAGGRVLTAGAHGATFEAARAAAYANVSRIHFRGEHHRTDVGLRR